MWNWLLQKGELFFLNLVVIGGICLFGFFYISGVFWNKVLSSLAAGSQIKFE